MAERAAHMAIQDEIEDLKLVAKMRKKINDLAKKEMETRRQEREKREDEGKRLIREARTREQVYADRIAELQTALFEERIDRQTFEFHSKKAAKERDKSSKEHGYTAIAAAEAGGKEAWSTMVRAMSGATSIPDQQLHVAKQQLVELRETNRREGRRKPPPSAKPQPSAKQPGKPTPGKPPAQSRAAATPARAPAKATRLAEIDRKAAERQEGAPKAQKALLDEIARKKAKHDAEVRDTIADIDAKRTPAVEQDPAAAEAEQGQIAKRERRDDEPAKQARLTAADLAARQAADMDAIKWKSQLREEQNERDAEARRKPWAERAGGATWGNDEFNRQQANRDAAKQPMTAAERDALKDQSIEANRRLESLRDKDTRADAQARHNRQGFQRRDHPAFDAAEQRENAHREAEIARQATLANALWEQLTARRAAEQEAEAKRQAAPEPITRGDREAAADFSAGHADEIRQREPSRDQTPAPATKGTDKEATRQTAIQERIARGIDRMKVLSIS